ncbi:helix-turn-helix domain-containing protein [Streptomyces sp. NPDC051362]|uniref:helix-turn-helix domain-containing protein n=1 Tax=Streptomyces sp. NPDC051362 TaxID=3365651 RepID=UPI00379E4E53
MTPQSARNVRRAQVRQLAQDEPDLSQREMAERLGISKDTVRRDLEAIGQDAPEPVAHTAPQVTEGGAAMAQSACATCATGTTGGADPAAQIAPAAALPRRIVEQVGSQAMSRCGGCGRDLALLAQTGKTVNQIVHQAIAALAIAYRAALARGEIDADAPFIVRGMTLETAPRPRRVDDPAPDTE